MMFLNYKETVVAVMYNCQLKFLKKVKKRIKGELPRGVKLDMLWIKKIHDQRRLCVIPGSSNHSFFK